GWGSAVAAKDLIDWPRTDEKPVCCAPGEGDDSINHGRGTQAHLDLSLDHVVHLSQRFSASIFRNVAGRIGPLVVEPLEAFALGVGVRWLRGTCRGVSYWVLTGRGRRGWTIALSLRWGRAGRAG